MSDISSEYEMTTYSRQNYCVHKSIKHIFKEKTIRVSLWGVDDQKASELVMHHEVC